MERKRPHSSSYCGQYVTCKVRARYRLQAVKYPIYVDFRMNQNGCADAVEYYGKRGRSQLLD